MPPPRGGDVARPVQSSTLPPLRDAPVFQALAAPARLEAAFASLRGVSVGMVLRRNTAPEAVWLRPPYTIRPVGGEPIIGDRAAAADMEPAGFLVQKHIHVMHDPDPRGEITQQDQCIFLAPRRRGEGNGTARPLCPPSSRGIMILESGRGWIIERGGGPVPAPSSRQSARHGGNER